MRDPLNACEGKVRLQTHYIRNFDHPARSLKPQNQEEQEFYTMVLHSICATCRKDPADLRHFLFNIAILSQFTSDCFVGFFLAKRGSRGVQTIGYEQKFPKSTSLNTVRATTDTDLTHSRDRKTFCWSRLTLLSDPAAKPIRIESPRVVRPQCASESRIQIHPTIGQHNWMKYGTNTDLT